MSGSSYIKQPGFTQETFVPDTLIAGSYPLVTRTVTVTAGQTLPRGAVLGQTTATGDYTLALAAATDGSETPVAILVDYCNASAGATQAGIYLSGEFDANALTFGTGITAASAQETMRSQNIYLKLNALSNTIVL